MIVEQKTRKVKTESQANAATNWVMISPFRPTFPSPKDYVANVAQSLELGRRPWDPKTEAERVAVFAAFPVLAK